MIHDYLAAILRHLQHSQDTGLKELVKKYGQNATNN